MSILWNWRTCFFLSPIKLDKAVYNHNLFAYNMIRIWRQIKAQLKLKPMLFHVLSISRNTSFIPTRLDSKSGIICGDMFPILRMPALLNWMIIFFQTPSRDTQYLLFIVHYKPHTLHAINRCYYSIVGRGFTQRDSQNDVGNLLDEHQYLFNWCLVLSYSGYTTQRQDNILFKHSSNMW